MAIRYFYMNPLAIAVELTDRVWTALTWHSSAEEMNAVQGEWVIEDPDSDLLLYAWRRVYVLDDDAPANQTVIGMGFIADVHVRRSEVYGRTPTSRAWHLTITDLNYLPSYPLFDAGDSPSRPEETDLARVAWYLTTGEAGHFDSNTTFIDTTGGATLDANDLLTQSPYDLFRGAMDQSGRNAFVGYDETVGPPDFGPSTGELFIWYAAPSADRWPALVSLSNDSSDIDPSIGVFALAEEDLDIHQDPTRIAWKLHVAYDGGLVSVSDDDIAPIYTAREMRVDAGDLTTAAKATTRGNRMLQEGRNPAARIQWGYHTRADYVNGLLAGQSFNYRATHLGGLTALGLPDFSVASGVQVRAMDRTVVEEAPGQYYVSGSAVPTGVALAFVCADGAYDTTPSQHFSPILAAGPSPEPGYFYYGTGAPASTLQPGVTGGWGFPAYNSSGADFAGDCTNSGLYFVLIGPGTLTVQTVAWDPVRPVAYWVVHFTDGGLTTVEDEVVAGIDAGTEIVITVPNHAEAENCLHNVYIKDNGGSCGSKWGWSGADWVSGTGEVGPGDPPPEDPPEDPGPHWTTAFMARTASSALNLTTDGAVASAATSGAGTEGDPYVISGKEFDALGANVIAIRLANISVHVLIEDCDFRDVAECIYAVDCTGSIKVGWCRYSNITGPNERVGLNRGNFVQVNNCSGGGRIYNNKGKDGDTEDIISLYKSSSFIVEDNHFEGVAWDSHSGSGIAIGDDGGSNNTVRNNILVNPGQVGMFIAGGTNNQILDNIIIGEQRANSNVGMYVWNQYVHACSGHTVSGNQVKWLNAAGTSNGYWNAGNCGSVTGTNDLAPVLDIEDYRVTL